MVTPDHNQERTSSTSYFDVIGYFNSVSTVPGRHAQYGCTMTHRKTNSERRKKLREEYLNQLSGSENITLVENNNKEKTTKGDHRCVYDLVVDDITLSCTVTGCKSRPIILLLNRINVLQYFFKNNQLRGAAYLEASKL